MPCRPALHTTPHLDALLPRSGTHWSVSTRGAPISTQGGASRTRAQSHSWAPRPPSLRGRASSPNMHLASAGLPSLVSPLPPRPCADRSRIPCPGLLRPPQSRHPDPTRTRTPADSAARAARPAVTYASPAAPPPPPPGTRAGCLPKPHLTDRPRPLPLPASQRLAQTTPSPGYGTGSHLPARRLALCVQTLRSPSSPFSVPWPLPDNRQGCHPRERSVLRVPVAHPRPSGKGASPRPLPPPPAPPQPPPHEVKPGYLVRGGWPAGAQATREGGPAADCYRLPGRVPFQAQKSSSL